jgi:hypothetical protein
MIVYRATRHKKRSSKMVANEVGKAEDVVLPKAVLLNQLLAMKSIQMIG